MLLDNFGQCRMGRYDRQYGLHLQPIENYLHNLILSLDILNSRAHEVSLHLSRVLVGFACANYAAEGRLRLCTIDPLNT